MKNYITTHYKRLNLPEFTKTFSNSDTSHGIAIYGMGGCGSLISRYLNSNGYHVIKLVDTFPRFEQKLDFDNIMRGEEFISTYSNELVIVTPMNGGEEIREYLISNNIPQNKILMLPFEEREQIIYLGDETGAYMPNLEFADCGLPSPTVTVLIVVYNKPERLLRRAIESILSQTYRDFELILVNHGSTSVIAAIIDEYASLDKRIKVITSQKNFVGKPAIDVKGIVNLRDTIKNSVRGEYCCVLDADDQYLSNYIEQCLKLAKQYDADFIKCASDSYSEQTLENLPMQNVIEFNPVVAESKTDKFDATFQYAVFTSVWTTFLSKDIFAKNVDYLLELSSGFCAMNDVRFFWNALLDCKRFVVTSDVLHVLTREYIYGFSGNNLMSEADKNYSLRWAYESYILFTQKVLMENEYDNQGYINHCCCRFLKHFLTDASVTQLLQEGKASKNLLQFIKEVFENMLVAKVIDLVPEFSLKAERLKSTVRLLGVEI